MANLTPLLQRLASVHGITDKLGSWQELNEPLGRNNSRFTAYHITHGPSRDGRSIEARLHLMMPDRITTQFHAVVDLRVDFGSSAPHAAEAPKTRLTLADLLEYLGKAWLVATRGLPTAAAEDPSALPLSGAPRAEIYIQSGRNSDGQANASVLDLVDLSELGSPRRQELNTMSVGVTAPLDLTEAEINELMKHALVWMVEDSGFVTRPDQG